MKVVGKNSIADSKSRNHRKCFTTNGVYPTTKHVCFSKRTVPSRLQDDPHHHNEHTGSGHTGCLRISTSDANKMNIHISWCPSPSTPGNSWPNRRTPGPVYVPSFQQTELSCHADYILKRIYRHPLRGLRAMDQAPLPESTRRRGFGPYVQLVAYECTWSRRSTAHFVASEFLTHIIPLSIR